MMERIARVPSVFIDWREKDSHVILYGTVLGIKYAFLYDQNSLHRRRSNPSDLSQENANQGTQWSFALHSCCYKPIQTNIRTITDPAAAYICLIQI